MSLMMGFYEHLSDNAEMILVAVCNVITVTWFYLHLSGSVTKQSTHILNEHQRFVLNIVIYKTKPGNFYNNLFI